MSLRSTVAFGSAMVLSTVTGVVLALDAIHHDLRSNAVVNALEIATGVTWLIWAVFRVGDEFAEQVEEAERKLHAVREVRRLKAVRRD